MKFKYLRYVSDDNRDAYERLGWKLSPSLAGTHHGFYSPWVAEWEGEGTPPEPEKERP